MIRTGFPDFGPTLGEVGERGVIDAIVAAAPSAINGDDAAVFTPAAPNSRVVASTDMLVAGRHFTPEYSTPFHVGQKAVVQNFADIEAMGARPLAALLAISAPPSMPVAVIEELARGVGSMTEAWSSELVGGDVTAGKDLVVSVTAIGSLGGNLEALRLDRARPGQRVVAHGRLGYSAAGLALLQHAAETGIPVPERFEPLVQAHQVPHITPGRGVVARSAGATAMTDNSDGLIKDFSTMARRSGVGIELSAVALSPDKILVDAARYLNADPWQWVLCGGEDHTLIGTCDRSAPVGFRSIGTVTRQEGVRIDGKEPAYTGGWESF
ncbi:thiamine-phosphate kinase [Corynebacterium aquatimens]|uniref:thiamine-phosphate kinase n=1 Tax=Corynebacterium TaxID=1716 RepID=UPI001F3C5CCB|nr:MULTISPECIES: thiamine-phosphate kinase [Corynebacterium]QYH19827.1 thiamine-phosphate kinase [Corynebacterium aquatimens]UIZ93037.1 thiamine-phosphate kinase [Corynebacterium sp. CNCTC7651]